MSEWWSSLGMSSAAWIGLCLSAVLIGMSKTGISGVSSISVPLLALVFGSKLSTGVTLPMLILADLFAVWYYNRHAEWHYLFRLLPWTAVGVLLGVWLGKDLSENLFKNLMALIILSGAGIMLLLDRIKTVQLPSGGWFAAVIGICAGFATMVGNLAGGFVLIYFLAMRLPKAVLIGTGAWFFLLINLFKLPFHIFTWHTVSWPSFTLNLTMIPLLLLGAWAGIAIVSRLGEQSYRNVLILLTAVGALALILK